MSSAKRKSPSRAKQYADPDLIPEIRAMLEHPQQLLHAIESASSVSAGGLHDSLVFAHARVQLAERFAASNIFQRVWAYWHLAGLLNASNMVRDAIVYYDKAVALGIRFKQKDNLDFFDGMLGDYIELLREMKMTKQAKAIERTRASFQARFPDFDFNSRLDMVPVGTVEMYDSPRVAAYQCRRTSRGKME